MRSLAVVALLFVALPAFANARKWQGIEPGATKREEVTQKFGEPSRVVTADGRETIAYFGKEAIKGTKEVQFKMDATGKVVDRIDVLPGPVIDKETIENSYGGVCPNGPPPAAPCFVKKVTDDFRTYYQYPKLGLVIFFNEDGKTVHSLVFTTQKALK